MTALIVGASGQDGSYLAELLLSKGYDVHGTKRRSSSFNTCRVDHLMANSSFHLHYADVCDSHSIERVMAMVQPDEIYNLAAQSHVGVSFEMPSYTSQAVAIGALNVFEAMRSQVPNARLYQASSSEMFGNSQAPQSEATPFAPRSPYACAKVFAHHAAINYRESYNLHISCGILFNHESSRRGETFVTRKITMAVARIKAGLQLSLTLGNLEARRDWGHAPEYVEAMWMMLQRPSPDDYVIGTGTTITVWEFAKLAFEAAGLDWRSHVRTDFAYHRPAEVTMLRANPRKAATHLHWKAKTHAAALAKIMVEADMEALKCDKAYSDTGAWLAQPSTV